MANIAFGNKPASGNDPDEIVDDTSHGVNKIEIATA